MNLIEGEHYPWQQSNIQVFWGEIAPSDHMVQFYENDNIFLNTLEGFVGDGFIRGESVIVIATPEHLQSLNARLDSHDFDTQRLKATDQYISLDASECARELLVNGWPDEDRFKNFVSSVMARARKNGKKVRVFGEIVAVLWEQGNAGATVQLEKMWHRIQPEEGFCLYCAYPKCGFTQDVTESIDNICKSHSKVIDGFGRPSTEIYYREAV